MVGVMRVRLPQPPAPSARTGLPELGDRPTNYNHETARFRAIAQRRNPKKPT